MCLKRSVADTSVFRSRELGLVEKAGQKRPAARMGYWGTLPDVDDPLMAAMRFGARAGVVATASGAAVAALWALPPQPATAIAALMHAAALSLALGFMIRSARSGDAAMRRTRWFLAAALGAGALDAVLSVGYVAVAGSIPVPSVVDVGLAWGPLAAYGVWLVPTRAGSVGGTARMLADGAVAASSLFFASWLAVLQPLAATGRWSPLGQAVQLAYPVLDVFVAAMVLSLLPRARADLRQFLNCAAAGLLLIMLSDSGPAVLLAQRGVSRFGWSDVTLQAGMGLLVFGALARARPVLRERSIASAMDRNLPYAPVAVGIGVGIWHVAFVAPLDLIEALLCALMIASIVARQIVFSRELGVTAQAHHHAAVHDALTGLANRKAFFARLTEHVSTPAAGEAAVLLFDLDGFKEVNDTLGHEAGDQVLIAYAATLRRAAPQDLVARLGGDEFAILVVGDDAEISAVGLAASVAAPYPATASTGLPAIAASIGIAVLRPGDAPEDLLRRADLAMYSAKRAPASRLAVFSEEMAAEADRRHLLVAALAGATARGEMRLVYQPLYRLGDGELAGAEALLRWTHPLLGVVPPDEFIPLAEDSGAISQIGLWVLEQSVAQMARWQQQGGYLPQLFVNVAAAQFTDDLPVAVARVLASHGLLPARLTLEITESQLLVLGANRPMRHLRESGVQIALDDFGTGYSSLAQLARIPVDILKIDRDFIRNLGESAGRPVMDAIISLSKALGLTTVAEGIEDLGQAAEASNAGIDIGQGYLFSRPLTVDDLALRLPPLSASPPQPVSASPDPITHPITDSDQAAPRRADDGPWEAPSARAPQPSARRRSRPTHRNRRLEPPELGRGRGEPVAGAPQAQQSGAFREAGSSPPASPDERNTDPCS